MDEDQVFSIAQAARAAGFAVTVSDRIYRGGQEDGRSASPAGTGTDQG